MQLETLERAKFSIAMFRMLTERFPDETADVTAEALFELIDRGIYLASTYGITLEPDVARFLELIVGLGEDFELRPDLLWIGETLRQIDHSPEANLDAILERLVFEQS